MLAAGLLVVAPSPARGQAPSSSPQQASLTAASRGMVFRIVPPVPAPGTARTARQNAPVTAGWRDGFFIESAQGDFRLQIGLLLQADGRFAAADEDAVTDTFLIRRARPNLRGRIADRFEFYLNPDFAGGVLSIQDAYLETVIASPLRIRVGKMKAPLGLERLQSAANILFVERALPTAVAPSRDIGVQALGDIGGGTFSYQAGVFNGVPDGGSADLDTTDSKDVAGRMVIRPFTQVAPGPWRGFGLALGGTRGRQEGAAALPSFRTASMQQPFFAYSGASADGVRTRYSPQVFYYHGAFGAIGEYVRSTTPVRRGAVSDNIAHTAWQLAISFVLTGEGATDRSPGIRPRNGVAQGGWGALQIAARYHALTVDDRAFALNLAAPGASRKAEAWTLGLNWILTEHIKYVFNVERTVFDDDAAGARSPENGVVFRTQLNF
jgi:phosphate-selective porin OprO and OprP